MNEQSVSDERCRTCVGHGAIPHWNAELYDDITCPDCKGTGKEITRREADRLAGESR